MIYWGVLRIIIKYYIDNIKNRLMSIYDKIMLRKRSVIETINDELNIP